MGPVRILIALAALLLSACGAERTAQPAETGSTLDLEALQKLADQACVCEMRDGNKGACWNNFERAHVGFEAIGYGTSSAPLSFDTICFDEAGQKCVYTGARLVDGSNARVCTDAQIDEIEALHLRISMETGGDMEAADAAARQRIGEMSETFRNPVD